MCGICGYVNCSKARQGREVLCKMIDTLHHRGPDSQGYFDDDEHQVFLGHSRLSIIDISDTGSQPMSLDNLTIVLNGEIYNYKEIKDELISMGHVFKSTSDTEVALHSFQEWGPDCVKRFIGMFAFAIYDSELQTVTLFRDRAGIKPLYYYWDGQALIFGSELKVMHQNPLFHKELNDEALGLYMRYGYIPTPYCIFHNTHKLMQGTYLVFNIGERTVETCRYWDLRPFYQMPKLDMPYEEALQETEKILTSAFNYRMVADVPVGVFLSAGIDSTSVVALLQKDMSSKLRTFTIGFESGNNEAPMAREIAAHLGTDHTEHYCSEEDALAIVKDLPYYYDEPFADSSAIPTTLVSKMARQQVKVALSADGGDEIFAGYNRYDFILRGLQKIQGIPQPLRPAANQLAKWAKNHTGMSKFNYKMDVLSYVLSSDKSLETSLLERLCRSEYTYFKGDVFSRGINAIRTVYNEENEEMTFLSRLLYADYVQYMQDDIMVKVDRASMSASLEGREPLLDHRIIEFVAQLPDDYKYGYGRKKRILRDIVYKYVPQKLIDKPKTGFSVPLSRWLNGPLADLVDYYLSDEAIRRTGVFNNDFVKYARKRSQEINETTARELWKIVQFQMWFEMW